MNKISFYFILFFSISLFADEDQTINLIIENCKSCHSENYEGNKYIKSLKELKKDQFITRMYQYKESDKNSAMVRIVDVLSYEDILGIADYIYD